MTKENELEHALGALTFACIQDFIDDNGMPTGGVYLPRFDAVKYAFDTLIKHDNNIRAGLLSNAGKPFQHVQVKITADEKD